MAPFYQMTVNMMLAENFDGTLSGEFFDDATLQELMSNGKTLDPQNNAVALSAAKARTIMLYTIGEYEENEKFRLLHKKCIAEETVAEFVKIYYYAFCSLNYLALSRKTGKKPSSRLLKQLRKEITRYDAFGSTDIRALLLFVDTETLSLKKGSRVEDVVSQYEHAITELEAGELFLLEAKATERLGDYLMLHGRLEDAKEHITKAWSLYKEHGALCMYQRLHDAYGKPLFLDLQLPEGIMY